jgi:hypothetical protein
MDSRQKRAGFRFEGKNEQVYLSKTSRTSRGKWLLVFFDKPLKEHNKRHLKFARFPARSGARSEQTSSAPPL